MSWEFINLSENPHPFRGDNQNPWDHKKNIKYAPQAPLKDEENFLCFIIFENWKRRTKVWK